MLHMIENANCHAPLLLIGPPGIGKTEMVRGNFDYTEVMLASTMVEEDIAGLPYREENYDYRTIPAMFRNLQKAHDLIYDVSNQLDEITNDEAQDINSYLINAMLDLDEVMGMLENFDE